MAGRRRRAWPFEKVFHSRIKLRHRIVAFFALGALAVSATLSALTYGLATHYLIDQRERSLTRQTYLNARALRAELRGPEPDTSSALSDLELSAISSVVFHQAGNWYATSVGAGRTTIPAEMRGLVRSGTPAHQRIEIDGTLTFVVGLPIPAINAEYFEVFTLAELTSTLRLLRNVLIGAAAATTMLGALVGFWASRRVLRPLTEIGHVATEIRKGALSLRLEAASDPDLEEFAASFNHMVDALQERIERDARFASSVSHELRSPLTSLVTAAEILEGQRAQLPERSRAAVDLLVRDVHRFQRLVLELLELSRAEADADEPLAEPVQLGELLLHAATSIASPSFTVDIDPAVVDTPLLTDKRRLERVVANLLENAVTHGHGVTHVAAHGNGAAIRISVEDEGPGVAPDERSRIFERFHRGAVAGRRGDHDGTGLGLALVAEHVRLLGGRVWVEDAPRGGACFVVEIPRNPA